ncbi:CDP-alcohol phosphatidyltransferase family protein [Nitriliruptoraceae bacterium ZYF776]|nr:CDP-alcohol phosphatidyltransferase family protein [Profundirhabdus halotolerans]
MRTRRRAARGLPCGSGDREPSVRVFDIGKKDGDEVVVDRVLTIPNLLSLARIAVLPFVYLDLVDGRHVRAFVLLAIFVWTDWFDGYLARVLDQTSRFGKLLDPISDRLLFVVVGVGMVVGDLLPLWALLVLVVRDALVLVAGGVLLARGAAPPAVTRLGKAATFGLMFALPAFVLASIVGDGPSDPEPVLQGIAWFSFVVNAVLYWLAAFGYARTTIRAAREATDAG